MADAFKACAVDGCKKNAHHTAGRGGYCRSHHYRFQKYGDPCAGGAAPGEPLQWLKDNAGHQSDECLTWPYEIVGAGYGNVKVDGKRIIASKVMCKLAHGDAPTEGHEAAHSCGNGHKGCVNPKHLRWATRTENMHDAMAHGTNVRGERCHFARITASDVLEIRRLSDGMLQREIAELFGITQQTVSKILSGQRWSWLEDGNSKPEFRSVGG